MKTATTWESSGSFSEKNTPIISRLARAPRWAIALLCAWGLLSSWTITQSWEARMFSGVQDFTVLYGGGRLAGTTQLYSHSALRAIERELLHVDSGDFPYVRLPILALAWKPLAMMPYQTALVLWKLITIAGFVLAGWLLPSPGRRVTWVAAAVSFGAWDGLLFGQDGWIPLIALIAFARFMSRGRESAAGFCLGFVVALKYHLFPLAILVLILHRKWRVLSRAGVVVAAAFFLSLAVYGVSWPADYIRALSNTGAPKEFMPNLGGFAGTAGLGTAMYAGLATTAALAVVAIARRASTQFAFGIAILAGILIAPHGYAYDYALFIPALLPLAVRHPWFEAHCIWWLMPFPLVPLAAGAGLAGQFLIVIAGAATLYKAGEYSIQEREHTTTPISLVIQETVPDALHI